MRLDCSMHLRTEAEETWERNRFGQAAAQLRWGPEFWTTGGASLGQSRKNGLGITPKPLILLVGPARFELATNGLRVRCSTN